MDIREREEFRMKLRVGLILAGALAFMAGGCAAGGGGGGGNEAMPSAPVGEVLEQGERPREDEHTREATDHLERGQDAATPDEARPHFQAAAMAAEQAVQADSTNPRGWYLQGMAYLGLEDYASANEALTEAERLRPIYQIETEGMREQAWINLYEQAAPLINEQRYDEALPIFEQANAIYQGRPEVMFMLGSLYSQSDEPGKAVESLQQAQALIESDRIEDMDSVTQASWREQAAQIPVLITQALMQSGDYPAAVAALRDLIAADPGNVAYMQNMASLFVQMEQPDSARAVYDRIMAQPGLTHVDHYQIGVGMYQLEDWQAAADEFAEAAEASPMDRDAVEMLARSLQIAHTPTETEEGAEPAEVPADALAQMRDAAERWLELDPNNRNAYLILAQTANRQGDGARAEELVEAIEALPILVQAIELRRYPDGGGTVSGIVENVSLDTGANVTMTVTFYDTSGTVIGTESAQIQAPAPENTAMFQVEFLAEQDVGGYSYEMTM
jgi:tetratricopeptide (TPR) repeat protein